MGFNNKILDQIEFMSYKDIQEHIINSNEIQQGDNFSSVEQKIERYVEKQFNDLLKEVMDKFEKEREENMKTI